MTDAGSRRVGLLAPMRSELKPLRRQLGLSRRAEGEHEWHVGRTDRAEVVASLANIGHKLFGFCSSGSSASSIFLNDLLSRSASHRSAE